MSEISVESNFEILQNPVFWKMEAIQLARQADQSFANEEGVEREFVIAEEQAVMEARAQADASEDGSGTAAIRSRAPNYLVGKMLYGLAIENLLKGLAIAKGAVKPSRLKIPSQLASHKLVNLSNLATYTLTADERAMLEQLTSVVEWAGRYPIAKVVAKQAIAGGMGVDRSHILRGREYRSAISEFYTRLFQEMERYVPFSEDENVGPGGVIVVLPASEQ